MRNLKMLICLFAFSGTVVGCAQPGKKTAVGAGTGAAAGAAIGAVIGHQSGSRTKGAAIGAILGGSAGGVIGNRMDKQAKELEEIAETKRTDQGIITQLESDILFDIGRAELKPRARENLSKMADIIKKYPENVLTIKGHTDSTGTDAVNQPLSTRRADSVRDILVARGVPPNTIAIVGMGETQPIAPNTTPSGRAENRRVDVEITADPSKLPANAK